MAFEYKRTAQVTETAYRCMGCAWERRDGFENRAQADIHVRQTGHMVKVVTTHVTVGFLWDE